MKEEFFQTLENRFSQNLSEISSLERIIQQKAWDHFVKVGLPDKKTPGYQYFPFSQLYQEKFDQATLPHMECGQIASLIYPECLRSNIVFVNGYYCPELSDISGIPSEVQVMRLADSLDRYGNFIQMRLSQALKTENDPFATLNIALVTRGIFIYVPPKVVVEAPIQCLYIITEDRPTFISPRVRFFVGRESQVKWVYEHTCLKDTEYFSNGVIDIALEEGAQFHQYGTINPCKNGWCFNALRANLKRDSLLKSIVHTSGTKSVRQDYRVFLQGENASCDLKGLSLLSENRQAHTNVHVEHAAPHCTSNQLFKNVLSDTSRASFEGKIYVHKKAQKTEAYQLNNNLLLSEKAIVNSKPNLEIFADDVKASHGATVSQLDKKHELYLKMRGIDAQTARKLLLMGFCLDLIDEIPIEPIHHQIKNRVERYFD